LNSFGAVNLASLNVDSISNQSDEIVLNENRADGNFKPLY